ncbi:MAG: hypothetical protein OEY91_05200 [Nitrospirota bacterium]|nr:hypothetical protein [Nitrospirota bacterium]
MRVSFALFMSAVVFGVALSGCVSSHLKEAGIEQDAGSIVFEKIVEFDREVHFLTPDERDTVIEPGGYLVEALQDGLRLKSADNETTEAVIVQAEPFTHEQSVEIPEPVLMTGENDQQLVVLLMPDGKAMEAVGSFSGIISRNSLPKLTFRPKRTIQKGGSLPGMKKGMALPKVNAIFTSPRLGAVSPQGTVYIKGADFGSSQGKVMLQVNVPVDEYFYVPNGTVSLTGLAPGTKQVQLTVQSWSPTQINALVPIMSGIPDQSAVLKIQNVHGLSNMGLRVSFYAARARVSLEYGENVTHTFCSNNANWGQCLTENVSDLKPFQDVCFSGAKLKADKTISAKHTNCDPAVDRDEGKDKYTIELKNNWVIEQIKWGWNPSSTSEKIGLPSAETLTQQYKGLSKMELWVPWEVSPGPDWLDYWVDVDITGPAGVLYGNRVYWKK